MWLRLYNLCWGIVTASLLPVTLNKHRFRKRWGLELPQRSLRKGIWIHALSVGEVLSAIPLVESISSLCDRDIGFTVTTQKGMEIAEANLKDKVELLDFFPFDFFWSVKRFVHHIDPLCFILVETDIWPFLLNFLHLKGIKCFWVNGRISPATYRRYSRFPWLIRSIFNCFEICMVQSEEDRKRLLRLGMDGNKVINTGNMKFDRDIDPLTEQEKREWRRLFRIGDKDIIWIAGSTHRGEEEIILDVFNRIRKKVPNLVLIIAPRNIERAYEIYQMGRDMGFNMVFRSKSPPAERGDVVIIDTIGELAKLYAIADIAFVGGSLVPFGGHNLIEPASFGCPVISGPHVFNFKDISRALMDAHAGIMAKDKEELYSSVLRLIEEPRWREQVMESCCLFLYKNKGATERVVSLIRSRLQC